MTREVTATFSSSTVGLIYTFFIFFNELMANDHFLTLDDIQSLGGSGCFDTLQ